MMCRPPSADDLVVLGVGLLLEVREDALPVVARHAVEAVEVEEVDELVVVDERSSPFGSRSATPRPGLLARHELGVAAEQDVGAAAGHVGGDRHRALAAGLGDDLGFLRVVLRVQHHVLDARAACSMRREPSRTSRSTRCRPAPAGPFACCLEDLVDDRVALLVLGAVDEVGLLDAHQSAGWSG